MTETSQGVTRAKFEQLDLELKSAFDKVGIPEEARVEILLYFAWDVLRQVLSKDAAEDFLVAAIARRERHIGPMLAPVGQS